MTPRSAAPPAADVEIRHVLQRYHSAMVSADITTLETLLDPDFVLVHLTGYVQPKAEWFEVMATGQFNYHRITPDPRTFSVTVTGAAASVQGRGVFDATINGTRRPWRLGFSLVLHSERGAWILSRAQYSLY